VFIAGVNDTGNKLYTSINDTNNELMPVLLTLVITPCPGISIDSMTPVIILSTGNNNTVESLVTIRGGRPANR
jgi:hypothetical protein